MAFGFLKDKMAKATSKLAPSLASVKSKLNPVLSKIATTTTNAMSDIGLLAANPDKAPKPARTIDEENLTEDVAHGLLLDYSLVDAPSFVPVLNKIAKECHKLHNLGIYADIVSITPSHVLKFETKDNFIHVECFNGEVAGNELVNDGTSDNPFQHPFDELLVGGGEDESDASETDGEVAEMEEETDEAEEAEEAEEADGETDSEEEEEDEKGEDDFGEEGEEEEGEDDFGDDDGDDGDDD